jgi:hypothetical protein
MELIRAKIARWPQLNRRITQVVEFAPLSMADARTLADTCCEVAIADDLLAELHRVAGGSAGYMTNGLARIEYYGKAGDPPMTLQDWKDRSKNKPFFLDRRL